MGHLIYQVGGTSATTSGLQHLVIRLRMTAKIEYTINY